MNYLDTAGRTMLVLVTIAFLQAQAFSITAPPDDLKTSFVKTPKSTITAYRDVEAVGSDGEMYIVTGNLSTGAGWAAFDRQTIIDFLRQNPQSHLKAIKKWIKINDAGREEAINVAMRENGLKGAITTKNVGRVLEVIEDNLSSGWEFYGLPLELVDYVVGLPIHPDPDYVGPGVPQDGWFDTEYGLTIKASGVLYVNGLATDADLRCENNGTLIKRPKGSKPGYVGTIPVLSILTDECGDNVVARKTSNQIAIIEPSGESRIVPNLTGAATVVDATDKYGDGQSVPSSFIFYESGKYMFYNMEDIDKTHVLPFQSAVKFTVRLVSEGDAGVTAYISDYLSEQRGDEVIVHKISTHQTKSYKGWRYAGFLVEGETIGNTIDDMELDMSGEFTDKLYNPKNGQYYDVDRLFE